jgi:hypothetical protein
MNRLHGTGGVPFGTYSIMQNFNYPIQVQPQCFMALCLFSWGQILHYSRQVTDLVDSPLHVLLIQVPFYQGMAHMESRPRGTSHGNHLCWR